MSIARRRGHEPEPSRSARGYSPAVDLDDLDADPHVQFDLWFAEARGPASAAPEQMALATATADGSAVGAHGAAQGPRRARLRLLHEPRRAARRRSSRRIPRRGVLYWEPLHRQVRIEGTVETDHGRASRPPTSARGPRQPDQRLGLAAVPSRSRAGPSSSAASPRSTSAVRRRRRRAAAAVLGRLPARCDGDRVLAGPAETASTTACATSSTTARWSRERLAP